MKKFDALIAALGLYTLPSAFLDAIYYAMLSAQETASVTFGYFTPVKTNE